MAEPIHRRIADRLRKEIASGELPPGTRLPREKELQDRFNASRNTIRLALNELSHQGLVRTRHGIGTFVTEEIEPFVVTLLSEEDGQAPDLDVFVSNVTVQGRKAEVRSFTMEHRRAGEEVGRLLQIDPDERVVMRSVRRLLDDKPWSMQASYYPIDIVKGTRIMEPVDIPEGVIRVLADHGHEQIGYYDRITARMPETEERFFLRLSDGIPVVVVERVAYDADRPIRLTRSIYPAAHNLIAYKIGELPADRADS